MPDKGWKAFERRLAVALGTKRIPVTGERAVADFEDSRFCYQAKKGRGFPTYLVDWIKGIREAGEKRGKMGVVVWQKRQGRDEEALVCIRFSDWLKIQSLINGDDDNVDHPIGDDGNQRRSDPDLDDPPDHPGPE